MRKRCWQAGVLGAALVALPARGEVTFLGKALIDGTGTDASGLNFSLEDGSRSDALDGFGSGIAYTGYGNRYVLLADRGPNKLGYPGSFTVDDTVTYRSRYQIFDLPVTPAAGGGYQVGASFVGTTMLKNEAGQNFVGLSSQIYGVDPTANLRLDPESIRVAPDGTVYVSDEYGPSVYHFDARGNRLGALAVPEKFKVALPASSGSFETSQNFIGRVAGKGMEGLAITPDGRYLLGAMQSPLLQDGGDGSRYTRMILFDTTRPADAPKEFLYKLDEDPRHPGLNLSKTGVCDIVAINDHQFLVDERDGNANNVKRGYVIDIGGATDIAGIDSLSALSVSDLNSIVPVDKGAAPLLDIGQLTAGLLNAVPPGYRGGLPDKIEGFTFGPDLPDGRRLLLVTNDDDFGPSSFQPQYPNYVMAFAIDAGDLPGFVGETFVPEPGGVLMVLGFGGLSGRRRGSDAARKRAG